MHVTPSAEKRESRGGYKMGAKAPACHHRLHTGLKWVHVNPRTDRNDLMRLYIRGLELASFP